MTHQRLALEELFKPITKCSVAIGEGDTAQVAREAMDLAAAPRPGPVHLSLANDVAIRECESVGGVTAFTAAGTGAGLGGIAGRRQAAQGPLGVMGGGAASP